MNANISRFVLASAALHVGLLGALNFHWTGPQLLPAALHVSLDEPSAATASPLRDGHSVRIATHGADKKVANALATLTDDAKGAGAASARIAADAASLDIRDTALPDLLSSPPLTTGVSEGDATNHQTDSSDPRARPIPGNAAEDQTAASSPPGIRWSAEPDEPERVPAAAAQSADPASRPLDTATLSARLQGRLREALAPYFTYPLFARRNGWEGHVEVGLRVEPDGRLSHVRIAHSSGYRTLDSAALTTLGRIGILPQAAGWLDGRHFDMVLPIDYRLIDGQS